MAVNKRVALQTLTAAGVPTLYFDHSQGVPSWPVMARPDFHYAGKWMFLCHTERELQRALNPTRRNGTPKRHPATHCQTYLSDAQEFRIHIVDGKSIKVSEKLGGGNHSLGATFAYPHGFAHIPELRQIAKDAVLALGLELGAVDLLYRSDVGAYVLEVNTAPSLTDPTSDTLARYVRALTNRQSVSEVVDRLSTGGGDGCG